MKLPELNNALHEGVTSDTVDNAKTLLVCGADVINGSSRGSLLHIAAYRAVVHMARVFLQDEVAVAGGNRSGQHFVHLAMAVGYLDVVRVLLDGGADVNGIGTTSTAAALALVTAQRDENSNMIRLLVSKELTSRSRILSAARLSRKHAATDTF